MKRILTSILFSIVGSWALSTYTQISVPHDVLSTVYTVAGVIFSVGMSITISPKTDNVANEKIKKSIRASYLTVRNSFMFFFGIDTVLFIVAEGFKIDRFPSFWDILCAIFMMFSIVYYIYNFIKLQELGEQIEDQVLKEKGAR